VFVCEKGGGSCTVDDKYTCTISEVFIRFFVALTNRQIFFTNVRHQPSFIIVVKQ
jgi:hypothetical protein